MPLVSIASTQQSCVTTAQPTRDSKHVTALSSVVHSACLYFYGYTPTVNLNLNPNINPNRTVD